MWLEWFPINLDKNVSSARVLQVLFVYVLLAGIALTMLYLWRKRNLFLYSRKVKGPFALPLIGSAYKMFGLKPDEIIQLLLTLYEQYQDIFKFWFGPYLVYMVNKPEYLEIIMTSPKSIHKDHFYKHLRNITGNSIMSAPVEAWKVHRKAITPSLNRMVLNSFMEIFVEKCLILNDVIEKHSNEEKYLDVFHLISTCSLDITCETAMGIKLDFQTTRCDFIDNFDRLTDLTGQNIFNLVSYVDFIYNMLPVSREYRSRIKKFKDFTKTMARKRKAILEEENGKEIEGKSKRIAFLDCLFASPDFTSEEEIQNEVNIFIVAATDTASMTLTCLIMCLGMYQDIQHKVYEEVMSVLGPDREITTSDLPALKYTELVIKETMRLFPAGATFARGIYENLDLGDVTLPAGSTVLLIPIAIHRNSKYWPNPFKFDPERFLPENVTKRHPCTYIPFSYGPRNCVGIRYAMMLMKTLISTVIRKYHIFSDYKSIEEIKLKNNIVLRLQDGTKVWMKKRS